MKDVRNKFKENVVATPTILASLIERFFNWYNKNRSKMTILTPGIHATNYSPDDNRFDHRPYLLPFFPDSYQMNLIRKVAAEMEERIKKDAAPSAKAEAVANAVRNHPGATAYSMAGFKTRRSNNRRKVMMTRRG